MMSDWRLDSVLSEQFRQWMRGYAWWGDLKLNFRNGELKTVELHQTATAEGLEPKMVLVLKGVAQ